MFQIVYFAALRCSNFSFSFRSCSSLRRLRSSLRFLKRSSSYVVFNCFTTFSINSSSVNAANGLLLTNAKVFRRPGPQYDWHPISISASGSSFSNFSFSDFILTADIHHKLKFVFIVSPTFTSHSYLTLFILLY